MNYDLNFMACLFQPDDLVEIRLLPSGKQLYRKSSEITGLDDQLKQANDDGQHVYIGANPRKQHGGKAEDVALARCIFVDMDQIDVDTALQRIADTRLPEPTCTVASGHGLHAYWRLVEPITDLTIWKASQKQLIDLLKSDKGIHDAPRIMRLPGFMNHKDPPAPCRVVNANPKCQYELWQIIAQQTDGKEIDPKKVTQHWLNRALDQADNGNRNNTGLWLACQLRDAGLTPNQVKTTLKKFASHQDESFDEDEALKIVQNTFTRPAREPACQIDENELPQKKVKQSEQLVRLALEQYRFGRTTTNEPFAVAIGGANIAIMFRGHSDALRSTLSREYRRRFHTTPSSSALADAMTALAGEALDAPVEPVALRICEHEGSTVFDLGDKQGQAIIVKPGSWEIVDRSPVLFRRTALTGEFPAPVRGGNIEALRDLLNVTDESWPLLLGWLVAALMPEIPHPILLLGGLQGTGKSTAARMLIDLIDPSPAPLQSEPRNIEGWAVVASSSWAICVDNISRIQYWYSDALCKAVTGDALVRRKLYTDSEASILTFRRVVLLTSIDPGAIRGDLGDRLLLIDLEPITNTNRHTESEINAEFQKVRPQLFGAMLDLLANVLARLPDVAPSQLPRMADFARVLAAMDDLGICNGKTLSLYLSQKDRISSDVLDSDPVATAIIELVTESEPWSGPASALLKRISPEKLPKGWPQSSRAMTSRLKRLIPALADTGFQVDYDRDSSSNRTRRYTISKIDGNSTDQAVQPPQN